MKSKQEVAMQTTGVSSFDTTVQKTNLWLKEIMEEIGSDDRHRAYLALRSVLQSLRDRLTVEEATDLGAQLPMLVRGIYYEAWNPSGKPARFDKGEFLANVRRQFPNEPAVDATEITRSVFRILDRHIADGEMEDIKSNLPRDLEEFWESQCR
jgi:uncharacterized protein (DUF2267 family)